MTVPSNQFGRGRSTIVVPRATVPAVPRLRLLPPWIALPLALLSAAPAARAHDEVPPQPGPQPEARWPGDRPHDHDLVVPIVVVVDERGAVVDAVVEVSLGPEIDAAALEVARKWVFQPAAVRGKPVGARARVAVRFIGQPAAGASPTQPHPHPHPPPRPQRQPEQQPNRQPQQQPKPLTVTVAGEAPPRSAGEAARDSRVIRAAPRRTASDALQVVPGVLVTQHGGEGKAHQIFFRGFDAVHGQDLEIQVAGAPVNEVSNVHGQGYADLHFIMPEVIRVIRALPGAYDPRQGDFAVAGSIRMDLGYEEPGVTAQASAGSFGGRRLFLAYHPEGAPAETFAAFEAYATDGFGPSRAASRQSLVAQVVHDLSAGLRARLMASTYAGRYASAGVLRLDDIERGRVERSATYDPKQGGSSARTQLVAELRSGGEDEGWAIAPFLVVRALRLRTNYTGFLEDPQGGDATQQINDAVTVGTTAHYRRRVPVLSPRDGVEVGVYARHDWIEQSQARLAAVDDRPTTTLVDARIRATNVAGWLDAAIQPIRRLTLRGGLRADGLAFATVDEREGADQARSAQGLHLGGRGTVDALVLPGLHAVASFGQGFRSPQARSLGDGERTPFARVISGEAGLRYGDEAIRASAAVFHTRLSEDLAFDERTGRNEPVPATARTGVAVDFVANPAPWLTSSVGATYTRAAFTAPGERHAEGDLLPYVPQVVVRADLALTPRLATIAGRGLLGRVGLGATLLHRRPLPYGEIGHDAMIADAGAALRYRFAEIGVDAFNLLDARWFDSEFVYSSSFERGSAPARVPARHVTVGAPQTFFLHLSLFIS